MHTRVRMGEEWDSAAAAAWPDKHRQRRTRLRCACGVSASLGGGGGGRGGLLHAMLPITGVHSLRASGRPTPAGRSRWLRTRAGPPPAAHKRKGRRAQPLRASATAAEPAEPAVSTQGRTAVKVPTTTTTAASYCHARSPACVGPHLHCDVLVAGQRRANHRCAGAGALLACSGGAIAAEPQVRGAGARGADAAGCRIPRQAQRRRDGQRGRATPPPFTTSCNPRGLPHSCRLHPCRRGCVQRAWACGERLSSRSAHGRQPVTPQVGGSGLHSAQRRFGSRSSSRCERRRSLGRRKSRIVGCLGAATTCAQPARASVQNAVCDAAKPPHLRMNCAQKLGRHRRTSSLGT